MMAERYMHVSWNRLHEDACTLARELAGRGAWNGIVGISRGGLIPAAIVARELECRMMETVAVATYQDEVRGMPAVLKRPAAAGDGAGFLVIDDLADTGATLRIVREMLPLAHFACIYAKPKGVPAVDSFVTAVPQACWVVFPWDRPPATEG